MEEKKFFQWILGERKGEVVIFDSIIQEDGMIFISFKDGSRINEELVAEINVEKLDGKMMAEIENPNNLWTFRDEWVGREEELWETNAEGEHVCVQPLVEGRKIVHLIPPRKSTSRFGTIANPPIINTQFQAPVQNALSIPNPGELKAKTDDPVFIVLDQAKKFESEISLLLTISLPSKDLYNIIKSNYKNGDEKTLNYIIDNLDIIKIKETLLSSFKDFYEVNDNK